MKRFSIRARLNKAFKVAQPLPQLIDLLSANTGVNLSAQVSALEPLPEPSAVSAATMRGLRPFHSASEKARL
jgi:hypothetical protein